MGNCCPIVRFRRRPSAINPKSVTLLLVGLDNAGKTTIAKRLSEEPLDGVHPTVGFSKVSLQEKGCSITIYDLGGGPQIRDIWPRYYADVHGVIFVVDASDTSRINECRKALEGILLDSYISGKPILLLANKQDVEGALDEIDIVDRLNVEQLVNQQKCPTLVELCSARHFSRKMDVGIDNGYKWLLRCISKDYPSLNMRVLKDLATQEELERIQRTQRMERIRERAQQERDLNEIQQRNDLSSKETGRLTTGEKPYSNGTVKMVDKAGIPGQIEDITNTHISQRREGSSRKVAYAASHSSHSFIYEKDSYDSQLIQSIEDRNSRKNFLVRPKSSGPRLGTGKSDSTKRKEGRRYRRSNKTAPNPGVELSLEPSGALPKVFDPAYHTEVKPFSESSENEENFPPGDGSAAKKAAYLDVPRVASAKERTIAGFDGVLTSKSTPNSRKPSALSTGKRCTSSDQVSGLSKLGKLPPLKLSGRASVGKELILDVTKLVD